MSLTFFVLTQIVSHEQIVSTILDSASEAACPRADPRKIYNTHLLIYRSMCRRCDLFVCVSRSLLSHSWDHADFL